MSGALLPLLLAIAIGGLWLFVHVLIVYRLVLRREALGLRAGHLALALGLPPAAPWLLARRAGLALPLVWAVLAVLYAAARVAL